MTRYIRNLILLGLISTCAVSNSREVSKPVEGLHENTPRIHAIIGATVVAAPGRTLERATIIVRDGLIEAVGQGLDIPGDARVWDLSGKTVYPGFIDAYSNFGMPEGLQAIVRKLPREPDAAPVKDPPLPENPGAPYWNPLVTPERSALDFYKPNNKEMENLNGLGFTVAAAYPGRGIIRGRGILMHLHNRSIQEALVESNIGQHMSFESTERGGDYPTSLMGSIALVRQSLYDARWYEASQETYTSNEAKVERPEYNEGLESLTEVANGEQLVLFNARNELDYQRIESIGKEFDLKYAILGNGYEYRRAQILKNAGCTVILPLEFPEPPPVERADAALDIPLEQLEHWELAPSNAAFLAKTGVPFCLTTYHMKDPSKEFWGAIRKAVKRGLSEDVALAALTSVPAALYSMDDRLGTIETGKISNLVVASGNLFSEERARVSMLWVDGDPVEQEKWSSNEISGNWRFKWDTVDAFSEGTFSTKGEKVSLKVGKATYPGTIRGDEILLYVDSAAFGAVGENKSIARLRAKLAEGVLTGTGVLPDAGSFTWKAELAETAPVDGVGSEASEEKPKDDAEQDIPALVLEKYPAGAFGVGQREQHNEILVQNATVWTSGPLGVLPKGDILIKDGKILQVGNNLKASKNALRIDATGKHVTAGIIDCHSHLAISDGVNEGSSAVSCETRISDVVDPLDINIYRQLAGGVTVSNSLHGSANPMGGQGQVLRMRWGRDAEGLKFKGAKPGIKFALGENVKQSNWGSENSSRYPQTRMGVVEIMESNFRAAADYQRQWQEFRSGKSILPPRRDLRMEAILETLEGERAVHIHSYRQDEILAFSRLAKELDLDVAVFHHILEGYKVAEALTDIDAGGSSFSDWWAYKFEVYDAIPQNAALMHANGVLVSINSDDAELATRLNTEAAKSIKYGGVTEEEALNFVTINPAIQLDIQDKVGSIEPGKDADFVIWSAHPLSTYAHAEQTWIEGVKYFDRETDKTLAQRDLMERERLVQKALKARLQKIKLSPEAGKEEEGTSE